MWQPSISIKNLSARATLISKVRTYFESKHVFEVDVPVIGKHSVTDPYLDALNIDLNSQTHWLQTSPEYFMKRLLIAGSGDIYYLGKAFRADETGRHHAPEFTMLEWYRLDFDDQQLIDDVFNLLVQLEPSLEMARISYANLFEREVGLNPHQASVPELRALARKHIDFTWESDDKSEWLDLLFTHLVEPGLPNGLCAIFDYPACQSALAKLGTDSCGHSVAKRFEVFLNRVELANGYWELTDTEEQRQRFIADNALRSSQGKPEVDIDEPFLAAMEHGLPACAGVALGIDRLIMALLKLDSIQDQQSFSG